MKNVMSKMLTVVAAAAALGMAVAAPASAAPKRDFVGANQVDARGAGVDALPHELLMLPRHADYNYTQDPNNDRCADVADNSQVGGARVILWDCAASTNQRWSPIQTFSSEYEGSSLIFSNMQSGKCMDVADNSTADGARIIQWNCHNGLNQQWELVKGPEGQVTTLWQLKNRKTGKCLDVANGASHNNAPLVQWSCHSGTNQQWTLYTP